MVIQFGGQNNIKKMSSSDLSMSRRIRRTPYTNKVEECGVTGFTVVNHMLLPKAFKNSVEEDYWHLKSHVQIWDVSCQRQVQITGPDSEKLVQLMTPRLIKNMNEGKCLYIPIIDENAGMINDPVLLKLENNRFWISIADSDVMLWAKGVAISSNLKVKIIEPEVYPLAIQGPKAENLLASIFGEKIRSIKFFNFDKFDFLGKKQIIARSGYSREDGFEIYFEGYESGEALWDTIWNAGKEFNISPGCPNLIDRIEAGLMSYGNDFTRENNPYECNLGGYLKDLSHDFIGKPALEKIIKEEINQQIRGVIFGENPCPPCSEPFPVLSANGEKIGQITSAIYSPRIKKNIGLSMIVKDYWNKGQELLIETPDGKKRKGIITSLPFP